MLSHRVAAPFLVLIPGGSCQRPCCASAKDCHDSFFCNRVTDIGNRPLLFNGAKKSMAFFHVQPDLYVYCYRFHSVFYIAVFLRASNPSLPFLYTAKTVPVRWLSTLFVSFFSHHHGDR